MLTQLRLLSASVVGPLSQATCNTTLSARRGKVNPGEKSSHLDPPLEALGYAVTVDRIPQGQRGRRNRHSCAGKRRISWANDP
jgi:hypothetical protein